MPFPFAVVVAAVFSVAAFVVVEDAVRFAVVGAVAAFAVVEAVVGAIDAVVADAVVAVVPQRRCKARA